jgi:competence protein ComK
MFNQYEINRETIAIVPINPTLSKVIEENDSFLVNKNTTDIIDDSCKYFGSSYSGRHEGTKKLIGINYKSPIIVEESKEIIFFPTSSPRFEDCYWISLDKIKKHIKSDRGSIIEFVNGEKIEINISSMSLENQILRATKLGSVLRKRKEI